MLNRVHPSWSFEMREGVDGGGTKTGGARRIEKRACRAQTIVIAA